MSPKLDAIYEEEIRRLPLAERLELAQRILADAALALGAGERRHSLLELEGLGAELWDAIDAQDYVSRLRDEWDDRT